MISRSCSKSSKLGFNSTWTMNFQIFKLYLEKAEKPEFKLPTFAGSWRKQENFRKASTSASLTTLKFDCVAHNKLWKFLKEMGVSGHLTYLLRHLYACQEATVRTRHGTNNQLNIGKGIQQAWIFTFWWLNLDAEYITQNARLNVLQDGIKIAGRNINNLRYANDTTLMAESKEELKSLDEGERGKRESWLKTQHSNN